MWFLNVNTMQLYILIFILKRPISIFLFEHAIIFVSSAIFTYNRVFLENFSKINIIESFSINVKISL